MSEKSCITINCGCCGGGTGSSGDGTPVGTIISYMGTKAPDHYLICDGAVINIADYPYLADQIKAEFGAADYFDGDGTTTFGVPDLRNEFLRGYQGESAKQLSGDVGKHQEATIIPNVRSNHYVDTTTVCVVSGGDIGDPETYPDTINNTTVGGSISYVAFDDTIRDLRRGYLYTSRPTNVAVLFCIKYE